VMGKYNDEIEINPAIFKIGKLLTMTFFIAHLLGCAMHGITMTHEPNWVINYHNNVESYNPSETVKGFDMSIASSYLAAIYWAITTMTTVGFGDITPDKLSQSEMLWTIFCQIIGTTTFAYVIGNVSALVHNISPRARMENGIIRAQRECLGELGYRTGTRKRYRQLAEDVLAVKNVIPSSEITEYLPQFLAYDLMSVVYYEALIKIKAFSHVDDKFPGFALLVFDELKILQFNKGDVIYHKGDNNVRDACFILNGEVKTELSDGRDKVFRSGDSFAEVGLFINEKVPFKLGCSFVARTPCRICYMSLSDLTVLDAVTADCKKELLDYIAHFGNIDSTHILIDPDDRDELFKADVTEDAFNTEIESRNQGRTIELGFKLHKHAADDANSDAGEVDNIKEV
jgi:hypothetical protein